MKHLNAHVDDVARGEVLPLGALADLYGEVLEGFVDNLKIGVEEFDVFEERNTGNEVVGLQFDALVGEEDTGPLLLGLVEQGGDAFLEFTGRRTVYAELQMFIFLAWTSGAPFVVEFRVDQFEHFLEGVHPGVGQHEIFHVQNDVAQGEPLLDEAVFGGQTGHIPAFGEQIGEFLVSAGNVGQAREKVRFFAVQVERFTAVGPDAHRRAFSIAVRLELFEAVLALGLLAFDDDVGRVGFVLVEDDDVGAFFVHG